MIKSSHDIYFPKVQVGTEIHQLLQKVCIKIKNDVWLLWPFKIISLILFQSNQGWKQTSEENHLQ